MHPTLCPCVLCVCACLLPHMWMCGLCVFVLCCLVSLQRSAMSTWVYLFGLWCFLDGWWRATCIFFILFSSKNDDFLSKSAGASTTLVAPLRRGLFHRHIGHRIACLQWELSNSCRWPISLTLNTWTRPLAQRLPFLWQVPGQLVAWEQKWIAQMNSMCI